MQYVLYGTKYIYVTNALAITFAAIKVKLVTMSAVSYCWVRSEICNILLKQYNDVLYRFFYKYFRNFFANLPKFRNGVYFLNFTINFVNKSTIKSFQNMTPLSRPNLYTIFFLTFLYAFVLSFVFICCFIVLKKADWYFTNIAPVVCGFVALRKAEWSFTNIAHLMRKLVWAYLFRFNFPTLFTRSWISLNHDIMSWYTRKLS